MGRKQHTFNVLIAAAFNKDFRDALHALAPHIRAKAFPDLDDPQNIELALHFRLVINHYEFIAAGIRNGDIDEVLVRDSERGTVLSIYEAAVPRIEVLRGARRRRSLCEHLEWLHRRWEARPPGKAHRLCEWARGRPFQGQRERVIP